MATNGAVTGFLPSTNGFWFTNSFPPAPDIKIDLGPAGVVGIGDASQGVCGGMAFAVRDYFEAGVAVPTIDQPPAPNTPLFNYITGRLIDSYNLPGGAAQYAEWMMMQSGDWHIGPISHAGTFSRTVTQSWPQVRSTIDSGHLCPLGLVTLHTMDLRQIGKCHQVLAYGYGVDSSDLVTLNICDPNTDHDSSDEVWIKFSAATPHTPSPITHNINIAEPTLHGFFCSHYTTKTPPAASS